MPSRSADFRRTGFIIIRSSAATRPGTSPWTITTEIFSCSKRSRRQHRRGPIIWRVARRAGRSSPTVARTSIGCWANPTTASPTARIPARTPGVAAYMANSRFYIPAVFWSVRSLICRASLRRRSPFGTCAISAELTLPLACILKMASYSSVPTVVWHPAPACPSRKTLRATVLTPGSWKPWT